jgi:hypothetical protein
MKLSLEESLMPYLNVLYTYKYELATRLSLAAPAYRPFSDRISPVPVDLALTEGIWLRDIPVGVEPHQMSVVSQP